MQYYYQKINVNYNLRIVGACLSVISKLMVAPKAALKEHPPVDLGSSITQWVLRTRIQSGSESVQR
jgi:subtilase family serine protease